MWVWLRFRKVAIRETVMGESSRVVAILMIGRLLRADRLLTL